MDSNSEIQGYNFYSMLHFHRKFSSSVTPVFNVDGSPNEAGQISEVVDVVLRYKTHSERMLLAVVTPLEDFLRKCSMGYILYP